MDLRHLLDWLRDPGAESARRRSLRGDAPHSIFAPLAFLALALALTTVVWTASDESLFENVFAPLALVADPGQDDGAGDGLAAAEGSPLSEPLAGADADGMAQEHLMAAAAGPIAMVAAPRSTAPTPGCPALLARTFNRLQTGEAESLCQYEGKVLLVVNTASYCGYTHQFEGLEAMYRKYRERGLVVVGFPSNDFGGQEPGSNKQIAEFCRLTYGVQFPMYEKSSVSDLRSNPLFADLAARTGKSPQWNFHKYVIDRSGQPVATFTSQVEPTDPKLVGLIERLLDTRPAKALPSAG